MAQNRGHALVSGTCLASFAVHTYLLSLPKPSCYPTHLRHILPEPEYKHTQACKSFINKTLLGRHLVTSRDHRCKRLASIRRSCETRICSRPVQAACSTSLEMPVILPQPVFKFRRRSIASGRVLRSSPLALMPVSCDRVSFSPIG